MGKVLLREFILVLVTGLFSWLAIPALIGQSPAFPLLFVGIFLGLTFTPMHAISLMIGRRLPPALRMWAGMFAWVFAFMAQIKLVLALLGQGAAMSLTTMGMELLPPMLGLILTMMAALGAPKAERGQAAAWSLFLFSLPMWVVRDVLVRMVSPDQRLMAMAMLGGTLYMFLHGLLRIYAPSAVEDEHRSEPLVRRPVPDAIVGLVEGTLHRRARPYATTLQGLDDSAISVLCQPDEVPDVVSKLTEALGARPFAATPGRTVKDKVEVVVRAKV
ncbi:MAG: hypothetical protein K0R39_1183 [Symbiobacteriaceae bacterium]|jgi:hypothetical protein|nr:hypothetical protein [Symbiobacteriaceae bacterium]